MIQSSDRSARLSHDGNTYFPGEAKIRCRRDYLIVEPLAAALSPNLQIVEHTRPVRGLVKAVGPGVYPKKYDHPDKHKRTKMWESKVFQATEVKVGDIVELGGIEFGGYSFQTFLWGDKVHLVCREADVSGVIEEDLITISDRPLVYFAGSLVSESLASGVEEFWEEKEIDGVKTLARATLDAALEKLG